MAGRRLRRAPCHPGAKDGKCGEKPGPQVHLLACRKHRLDEERVAEQRDERREIGQRKKAIGVLAGSRAREPGLDEGTGRGEQEVRQAHGRTQQKQDAADRLLAAVGLPALGRHDRQRRQRGDEQDGVHDRLAPAAELAERMRVRISGEQHNLEEEHAGRPHRGAAAEPRQDQARDQRLHQEQQERRKKDRGRVDHRGLSRRASPVRPRGPYSAQASARAGAFSPPAESAASSRILRARGARGACPG